MTEPLKPRIDFTGTLEQAQQEAFKTAQTFSGEQAEHFAPALTDEPSVEEGQRKRSLRLLYVRNVACGVRWLRPGWRSSA